MLTHLQSLLERAEARVVRGFRDGISTPRARRLATVHFHLSDHAFLRGAWTNLDLVAPGVWRSNQPDPARIGRYADMGIRSILSLRGDEVKSWKFFEEEACRAHGIDLKILSFRATKLSSAEEMIELIDVMGALERPLLIHCKSGADRTGLASALYLLAFEGASVREALNQLSLRYLHRKDTKTGILDYMIEAYGHDRAETGIDLRTWLVTAYDPKELRRARKAELAAAKRSAA